MGSSSSGRRGGTARNASRSGPRGDARRELESDAGGWRVSCRAPSCAGFHVEREARRGHRRRPPEGVMPGWLLLHVPSGAGGSVMRSRLDPPRGQEGPRRGARRAHRVPRGTETWWRPDAVERTPGGFRRCRVRFVSAATGLSRGWRTPCGTRRPRPHGPIRDRGWSAARARHAWPATRVEPRSTWNGHGDEAAISEPRLTAADERAARTDAHGSLRGWWSSRVPRGTGSEWSTVGGHGSRLRMSAPRGPMRMGRCAGGGRAVFHVDRAW